MSDIPCCPECMNVYGPAAQAAGPGLYSCDCYANDSGGCDAWFTPEQWASAVARKASKTDVAAAPIYIVKYQDPTAGEGISGVWRDEKAAVDDAWSASRECCRFPGEEDWPKEVPHHDKEILRIEYGPESYNTVEKHEVKS